MKPGIRQRDSNNNSFQKEEAKEKIKRKHSADTELDDKVKLGQVLYIISPPRDQPQKLKSKFNKVKDNFATNFNSSRNGQANDPSNLLLPLDEDNTKIMTRTLGVESFGKVNLLTSNNSNKADSKLNDKRTKLSKFNRLHQESIKYPFMAA